MKSLINILLGIILIGVGVFIFLSNVIVTSMGFYKIGAVSTAPILIIIFMLLVICAIGFHRAILWLFSFIDILAMLVSIILGTHFVIAKMSAMTLILMVGMIAVGLGLVIRGFLGLNNITPSD